MLLAYSTTEPSSKSEGILEALLSLYYCDRTHHSLVCPSGCHTRGPA